MKIKNIEEMNTDTGQKYYVLVCGEPDSLCEKRHMVRANEVVLKDRPLEFWEKATGALCREYLAMKWIDLKDKAPKREQGKKILAFGAGYVFEAEFDDGEWCNIGGDEFTHWMEYPALPEKQKEGEG